MPYYNPMGGTPYPPPTYDPYRAIYNVPQSANAPRYEIIRVNGKNGAEALQMSPNSNVIVMDDTAPMVWLCSTDGAGYKTVSPFDIAPHKDAPSVDTNALEVRVKRLEDLINGYQSNGGIAKSSDNAESKQ